MKYVVGHKNPDTDSVVSAYCLAEFLGDGYKAARAGEPNKETQFVFKYSKAEMPELVDASKADAFVLVDHNGDCQIPKDVDRDRIEMIVDHHKLEGLSLNSPISIRIEPVGSTSTLVAKMYSKNNIEISKEVAALLLSGIISDTLKMTSPTTTSADKETAKELATKARINIDELASEMFKIKSDLTGMSISKVVGSDYKNFQMGKNKVGFGVFETVDPKPAIKKKKEIIAALTDLKNKEEVNLIFFGIVDIIKTITYLVILSKDEAEVAEKGYGGKTEDNILKLTGIVSRKKEMIPLLEKALT
ncbi:MAG: putative manganese-dependent inorganic pyrophosphatase [candidate division CPR2 bacterium GW2011_GWC1_39_9]|uniref:inorganic diphosphatase n=1 Tax=candidate division CPR2 bacterium GW2011_GWC2_39_10 TaxID=1618345 RepID=A0A0G0PZZ6_UNCC2|nr:MAG: putative manganese-dependent inorganic pyrophosphatase [candidate division CPR2 bacterium GW2011_GWC2_39_10]KKR34255.1 MAG: putative manganese-dependent inorganic pyrophosphatase [candidate division CPR2 bacterium GW2011_GWC1_39_9]